MQPFLRYVPVHNLTERGFLRERERERERESRGSHPTWSFILEVFSLKNLQSYRAHPFLPCLWWLRSLTPCCESQWGQIQVHQWNCSRLGNGLPSWQLSMHMRAPHGDKCGHRPQWHGVDIFFFQPPQNNTCDNQGPLCHCLLFTKIIGLSPHSHKKL